MEYEQIIKHWKDKKIVTVADLRESLSSYSIILSLIHICNRAVFIELYRNENQGGYLMKKTLKRATVLLADVYKRQVYMMLMLGNMGGV